MNSSSQSVRVEGIAVRVPQGCECTVVDSEYGCICSHGAADSQLLIVLPDNIGLITITPDVSELYKAARGSSFVDYLGEEADSLGGDAGDASLADCVTVSGHALRKIDSLPARSMGTTMAVPYGASKVMEVRVSCFADGDAAGGIESLLEDEIVSGIINGIEIPSS